MTSIFVISLLWKYNPSISYHLPANLKFEVFSVGLGMSLYLPIFLLLRLFLWIFAFETFKNTYLSLFLLKSVDIDPLQTQVFQLSNLSTYSLSV